MLRFFVLASALAIAGAAHAQSADPHAGHMMPPPPGGQAAPPTPPGAPNDPWPRTLAQMQAMADARFDEMDTDKDGFLNGAELAALSTGEAGQRGGARLRARLVRADADHDGRISKAEANAGIEQRFARMDRNGDGVISDDERGMRGAMGVPGQSTTPDMGEGF